MGACALCAMAQSHTPPHALPLLPVAAPDSHCPVSPSLEPTLSAQNPHAAPELLRRPFPQPFMLLPLSSPLPHPKSYQQSSLAVSRQAPSGDHLTPLRKLECGHLAGGMGAAPAGQAHEPHYTTATPEHPPTSVALHLHLVPNNCIPLHPSLPPAYPFTPPYHLHNPADLLGTLKLANPPACPFTHCHPLHTPADAPTSVALHPFPATPPAYSQKIV